MSAKVIWLFCLRRGALLDLLYLLGIRGARIKTASDYFYRRPPTLFMGVRVGRHGDLIFRLDLRRSSGLVYRDGFSQYAYASFYTITIPFTGVIFLKRQWMLGKRFELCHARRNAGDYFPW